MSSVAVIMPTYNHSLYIAEAIDSFLRQQTSFPCKLYISDDCSTDTTAEIAKRYANENPDRITVICKSKNEGLMRNYKTLLDSVKEDYIVVLESDDYWTDSFKLQKQYDLMESCKECGLCFSRCDLLINGKIRHSDDVSHIVESNNGSLYSYLLLRALVWSPTIFFRRASYLDFCSIDDYIRLGFKTFDAPLILSIAANEKLCYIGDITAVYRISSTSISNNKSLKSRLAFECSANKIRRYVISHYGYGNLSWFKIRCREIELQLRIIWRHLLGR
ncbi:MAG: glycosyltransferase [Paludibacteraceae bacterium]|nr:glycosyltransferase [Paludibacteraceae bacterium]